VFAVTARRHDIVVTQESEVAGYFGLAFAKLFSEIADGPFLVGHQTQ